MKHELNTLVKYYEGKLFEVKEEMKKFPQTGIVPIEAYQLKSMSDCYEEFISELRKISPAEKVELPSHIRTSILPSEIEIKDSLNPFMGSLWQNSETEVSVFYLVAMAKKHGSWRDFTRKEIVESSKHAFCFNKLLPSGAILENNDGTFSFTDEFINECYKLSKNEK